MACALLFLDLVIPGCRSLKDKRGKIKPLLTRLHREFNISSAELEKLDKWDETIIGCAMLANDKKVVNAALAKIPDFIQNNFPHIEIVNFSIRFY